MFMRRTSSQSKDKKAHSEVAFHRVSEYMLKPKIENAGKKTVLKRVLFISVLFPILYFHSPNSFKKKSYVGKNRERL